MALASTPTPHLAVKFTDATVDVLSRTRVTPAAARDAAKPAWPSDGTDRKMKSKNITRADSTR